MKQTIKLQSGELIENFKVIKESTTHVQILTQEQVILNQNSCFGEWFNKNYLQDEK